MIVQSSSNECFVDLRSQIRRLESDVEAALSKLSDYAAFQLSKGDRTASFLLSVMQRDSAQLAADIENNFRQVHGNVVSVQSVYPGVSELLTLRCCQWYISYKV